MAQLTALNAKITGDASGFAAASKLAAYELNKLRASQSAQRKEMEAARAAADAHANSTEALVKKYRSLQMETDAAYAGMQRYKAAAELTTQVAKAQAWSQEQLGAELQRLANHYGVAEQAGFSFNDNVRNARFHSANLAAQFNDIGVMLASGQSPFILAMQQGTQVSQVLNTMGGTGRQQLRALKDAFLSILNPASLLTIGVIALSGYIVQWAMSMGTASAEAERLKERQEQLKTVNDELLASIKNLRIEQELASGSSNLAEEVRAKWELKQLELERSVLMDTINRLNAESNELMDQTNQIKIQEVMNQIAANEEAQKGIRWKLEAIEKEQAQLAAIELAKEAQQEFKEISASIANLDIAGPFWDLLAPLDAAIAKAKAFNNEWGMASGMGPPAEVPNTMGDAANTLFGNVPPALGGTAPMTSSPRPKAAPQGTGGLDWGAPQQGGSGGGRQSVTEKIQQELLALQQSLMTQEELERQSYDRRLEVLKQSLDQQLITKQQYAQMMEQVEASHSFAMLKQSNNNARDVLGNLQTVFQGSKKIGAAIALANSYLAFTEVLKDPFYIGRPFARFVAAAAALASGLQAVRSIKSASPGGAGGAAISTAGGAAAGAGGAASRPQQIALTLSGGPTYDRKQIIELINAINQASEDGARIRVA